MEGALSARCFLIKPDNKGPIIAIPIPDNTVVNSSHMAEWINKCKSVLPPISIKDKVMTRSIPSL